MSLTDINFITSPITKLSKYADKFINGKRGTLLIANFVVVVPQEVESILK